MFKYLLLLSITVLVACSDKEDTSPPIINSPQAEKSPDIEWTHHGFNDAEQRYVPLDQINVANVNELGLEWSFDMYTRRGVEATPLVVGGIMYVSGSWSMVYALDAKTGALKWFYDPKVARSFAAKGCCDAVNRGVAYKDGKIYIGVYDGRLTALDAETGKVVWEVQTTDQTKSYTITGAPRIAGNNIIIGNGGAELGVRGYVTAFDIKTGEQQWRFYTVPGNPADGFENAQMEKIAETWSGKWWEWGGGGTVWDAMAYDPELNLFYIGVGNGSPWAHKLRSPEGGDNLFVSSIVALRPDTGEYVWHYQTTPGDNWDFTATQHMILAELKINGVERKVIMQAPKNGFFYVIDRATGELLSANNYVAMNWATGVDMKTGRPIETPDIRDSSKLKVVFPAMGGGHNWPPMSFNPNNGLVYIPTMNFPMPFLDATKDIDKLPGQGLWNLGFDTEAMAAPEVDNIEEVLAGMYSGALVAWDPVKQEARWTVDFDRITNGGILTTGGGLLFQGDSEGALAAYNADNGEKLWSFWSQTGAMAAPITYTVEGEQYIAMAVGWGGGFGTQGGGIVEAYRIKNRSRVLVFKLGANGELPPVPEAEVMAKPALVTASDDVINQGKVIYHRHCYYCHGDGVRSGGVIRDLRYASEATHMQWNEIVIDGLYEPLGMISFKQWLSEDDAQAVRQYVLSRANATYNRRQASATQ